jgi:hypothetical protein
LAAWMMFLLGRQAMFGQGTPHPLALNHGNTLALTGERPGEELGAFAAANDDEVVLFGRESGGVGGEF